MHQENLKLKVARNMRQVIKERGLTQAQAGAKIGVSQQRMASYINTTKPCVISAVDLMLFAKAMSKSLNYFYKDNM